MLRENGLPGLRQVPLRTGPIPSDFLSDLLPRKRVAWLPSPARPPKNPAVLRGSELLFKLFTPSNGHLGPKGNQKVMCRTTQMEKYRKPCLICNVDVG